MSRSAVYIAPFTSEEMSSDIDLAHSPAGNNVIETKIRALQAVGVEVDVLSTVMGKSDEPYTGPMKRSFNGAETTSRIFVPPSLSAPVLGRLFLIAATAITLGFLLIRNDYDDVIFYNFVPATCVPALLSRLFGCSVYADYSDGYFVRDEYKLLYVFENLIHRFDRWLLDGAICINSRLADSLDVRTTVVRGMPSVGRPETLPNPEYERDDATVVMFAGRFDELRGVYTFLELAEELADETEELEFWLSGYGGEKAAVERAVSEIDHPNIRFFGRLPWEEYRRRIVSADVLVNLQKPELPISRYTFPMKLLDFMSTGNVVISTNMADVKEFFDDEVVIIGAHEEPLDTVRYVAGDVDEYAEYGVRAENWIRQECDERRIGTTIVEFLTD